MKALAAIETSTRSPSVALSASGRVQHADLSGQRRHASDLLPALAALLEAEGLEPRELDAIAVGIGPGSYTGLRVGCATALGLARGTGAKLCGVPSTEALVFAGLTPGQEAGVLIDARAGEVYFAHYRRVEHDVEVVAAPCVVARAELAPRLPRGLPLFADQAALAAGAVEARAGDVIAAAQPSAVAVLALAQRRLEQGGAHTPEQVQPLYLRAFAAVARKR